MAKGEDGGNANISRIPSVAEVISMADALGVVYSMFPLPGVSAASAITFIEEVYKTSKESHPRHFDSKKAVAETWQSKAAVYQALNAIREAEAGPVPKLYAIFDPSKVSYNSNGQIDLSKAIYEIPLPPGYEQLIINDSSKNTYAGLGMSGSTTTNNYYDIKNLEKLIIEGNVGGDIGCQTKK